MRIKFEGRWTVEQCLAHLHQALQEMEIDDGLAYLSGINVYFHCEDQEKNQFTLVGDNGQPVFITLNNPYKQQNRINRN